MGNAWNWNKGLPRKLGMSVIAVLVGIAIAYQIGSGVVIDELTGKPMSGVFVVAKWSARAINPVHSNDVCFKVVSTKTDVAGQFKLWPISWNFNPLHWFRKRELYFYMRGNVAGDQNVMFPLLVSMRRDDPEAAQRMHSIHELAKRLGCGPEKQQREFLLPVYRGMAEEAREIADRTGKPGFANSIQWYVDNLTYPRQ